MELFDLINENELDYMRIYRSNYVNATSSADFADNKHILRIWNKEKTTLGEMFGNKLIVSKDIAIDMPTSLIEQSIQANDIIGDFISKFNTHIRTLDIDPIVIVGANSLLSTKSLSTNSYDDAGFTIEYAGKKVKVQTGCKPIRMIKKMVDLFGFDESKFEEFRLEQSLLTNQRKITGELCLSIHPLDYMTMSDNESGWHSCMSWKNAGCYCRGTVEMMNSPYVVVGYLKDSHNTLDGCWNSKKWRSLFIVNKDMIQAVKAYPYQSDELTIACLDEIKKYAEPYFGTEYTTEVKKFADDKIELNSEKSINVSYETDTMYNDFGSLNYHLCYPALHLFADQKFYTLNYSGLEECMCCGSTDEDFEDEGSLSCFACATHKCDYCGEYTSEDLTEVEGDFLCENCLESEAFYDEVADCYFYNSHLTELRVVRDDNQRQMLMDGDHDNDFYNFPCVYVCLDNGCMDNVCSNYEVYGSQAFTTLDEIIEPSYFGWGDLSRLTKEVNDVVVID